MFKAFVLLVCLVTFNCKSVQNQSNLADATYIVDKGSLFGSGEEGIGAQNLIITNPNDWQDLMDKMNAVNEVTSGFSETEIDFSTYNVVAVFDSVKGSGGHEINLKIEENAKCTVVFVDRKSPDGVATSVMTQPYCIIKIPKRAEPIIFE